MGEDKNRNVRESQIDQNLKRVFQKTLDEDLPNRFRDLLAELKKEEGKANGSLTE